MPRKFTPGMTCGGWGGRPCGRVLNERADCYANRILCYPCGRAEQTEVQRLYRESHLHKCVDCPAKCGRAALRCGKCGQRYAAEEKRRLDAERLAAPKKATPYFVPRSRWDEWRADRALYDPARVVVVDGVKRG